MSYNSKYTGQEVEQLLDKTGKINVSAEDAGVEIDDVIFGYATTQYVDDAISNAIVTTLNTEV